MEKKLTKEFIQEQKTKLLKEKEKIVLQISNLKKGDPFADPDHASDNAAVDTDVREQVGHDTVEAEIKDLQKRLSDISLALTRIEKGRYGYCAKCSKAIIFARLKLVPEAQYCMDCEKLLH